MSRSRADYERFYAHYVSFVSAYVARRVAATAVDDQVAEFFVVALRRLVDVPDDALPWLYRTAHNVITTSRVGHYDEPGGERRMLIYIDIDNADVGFPLVNPTVFGQPLVLRVIQGAPGDEWLRVQAPVRPHAPVTSYS